MSNTNKVFSSMSEYQAFYFGQTEQAKRSENKYYLTGYETARKIAEEVRKQIGDISRR